MMLEALVNQVKQELKQSKQFDMRTFDFLSFDHVQPCSQDTVEFFVYEKPRMSHRKYVVLTYDLVTGQLLYEWSVARVVQQVPKTKRMIGFERAGQVIFFPLLDGG